jgi:hypothetical protein
MARDFVRTSGASGQRITAANAVVSNAPCTLACWAKTTNLTDALTLLSVSNGGAFAWMNLLAYGSVAGDPVAAYITLGDTTATTTSGYVSDTWFHAAATFNGNSPMNLAAFFNGGSKGTNSRNYTPLGINRTTIGALAAPGGTGFFGHYSGQIAECGIWDIVLSDDEIASLSKGITCDKVRPQNLKFYAPLVREIADYKSNLALTNVNTTVANHTRVYA